MASLTDTGFDASAITTSRDFESMLRQLGFSRAFARKATAHGFNAAHTASASDQSIDDHETNAALARMRSVAANLRKNEND
jgi:hypothetical protein